MPLAGCVAQGTQCENDLGQDRVIIWPPCAPSVKGYHEDALETSGINVNVDSGFKVQGTRGHTLFPNVQLFV